MTGAAKWLRRMEIALAIGGMAFLGGAFAATVHRWDYQARQERALLGAEQAAVSQPAPTRGVQDAMLRLPLDATTKFDEAGIPNVELQRDDSARLPESLPRDHSPAERPAEPAAPKAPPKRAPGADPLVLGRIEIPSVGIRAIVREGDDDATLAIAVGHVSGTSRPGEPGNTALAAHRDTFFRPLRNIQVNDRVRIVRPPHTWEYRVTSIEVVAPTYTRVLLPTADEQLTLVTCYPFNYVGSAPDRFIVHAARVE